MASPQVFAAVIEVPIQQDIDLAFDMILRTQIGKAVCRDLLGADAQALELHLGISKAKAEIIAKNCAGSEPSQWIYPTSPNDIRKIALKPSRARSYKLVRSEQAFPIESWTDPFANTTTIVTTSKKLSFPRLVQILAHEMAVYFDSKSHPLHPGAEEIPHLRNLNIMSEGKLNPMVALSNPLQAHTLTYLRALQVEFAILRELVDLELIVAPKDLSDPYLLHLVSEKCAQACIEELIVNMREAYLPVSLPLLAFAPHYRAVMLRELPKIQDVMTIDQRSQAQYALNYFPVQFMKRQFTGDVVSDLSRVFFADESEATGFQIVTSFLQDTLWDLEKPALFSAHFTSGVTLLEFMKRPLLSGYNIALASGPRVRVRTGSIE